MLKHTQFKRFAQFGNQARSREASGLRAVHRRFRVSRNVGPRAAPRQSSAEAAAAAALQNAARTAERRLLGLQHTLFACLQPYDGSATNSAAADESDELEVMQREDMKTPKVLLVVLERVYARRSPRAAVRVERLTGACIWRLVSGVAA